MTQAHEFAAVEAHKKAFLAQRPHVSEEMAIAAMHDYAQNIANQAIPASFNEDIFVVLFAQFKDRDKKFWELRSWACGVVVGGLTYLLFIIFGSAGGIWVPVVAGGISTWLWSQSNKELEKNRAIFWDTIRALDVQSPAPEPTRPNLDVIENEPDQPLTDNPASVFDSPRQR